MPTADKVFNVRMTGEAAWWLGTLLYIVRSIPSDTIREHVEAGLIEEEGEVSAEATDALNLIFTKLDDKLDALIESMDELADAAGLFPPEPAGMTA